MVFGKLVNNKIIGNNNRVVPILNDTAYKSGIFKLTIINKILTVIKLKTYVKLNKNHSPYFFKIILLKSKFNVKNFNNKKNNEWTPINPPIIKSYKTPHKIIKIFEVSKLRRRTERNNIIVKKYGWEMIKNDKKLREIWIKQANKIINAKNKLFIKFSDLKLSIELYLITKFIKPF